MMRHRPSFIGSPILAGVVWAMLSAQPANAADPIRINPGYVSLLKLEQTVSTIVIGNPDVVDATLQGKNTILFTAKKISGSAATNVIVLNPQDGENLQRHDHRRGARRGQDRDTQRRPSWRTSRILGVSLHARLRARRGQA